MTGTIEEAYVEVDGARIHYLAAGDGPPLVLVHGGGLDNASLTLAPDDPRAATTHRVVAPDLPGAGRSEVPDADYTMEYFVPLKAVTWLTVNQAVPGSEITVIDGCGHWPMREKPAEFLSALRNFLDRR